MKLLGRIRTQHWCKTVPKNLIVAEDAIRFVSGSFLKLDASEIAGKVEIETETETETESKAVLRSSGAMNYPRGKRERRRGDEKGQECFLEVL